MIKLIFLVAIIATFLSGCATKGVPLNSVLDEETKKPLFDFPPRPLPTANPNEEYLLTKFSYVTSYEPEKIISEYFYDKGFVFSSELIHIDIADTEDYSKEDFHSKAVHNNRYHTVPHPFTSKGLEHYWQSSLDKLFNKGVAELSKKISVSMIELYDSALMSTEGYLDVREEFLERLEVSANKVLINDKTATDLAIDTKFYAQNLYTMSHQRYAEDYKSCTTWPRVMSFIGEISNGYGFIGKNGDYAYKPFYTEEYLRTRASEGPLDYEKSFRVEKRFGEYRFGYTTDLDGFVFLSKAKARSTLKTIVSKAKIGASRKLREFIYANELNNYVSDFLVVKDPEQPKIDKDKLYFFSTKESHAYVCDTKKEFKVNECRAQFKDPFTCIDLRLK